MKIKMNKKEIFEFIRNNFISGSSSVQLKNWRNLVTYLDSKKYKLDSYYKDLYNELTLSFDYFGSEKNFRKNINELKELIGLISDTLNYLSDNKSHWLISNDTIIFDSKEKLNEFGILLSKIEGNNEYINQKDITKQDKTL